MKPAAAGDTVVLDASESRHVLLVLRLRPGQRIEGVDGAGWEYGLELTEPVAGKARARVLEKREASPRWLLDVTVAMGIVKGARMDWAVEKAAELGARRFIPFAAERTVTAPDPAGSRTARWKRMSAAALKQSLGPYLMQVSSPLDFDALVEIASHSGLAFLADQEAPRMDFLPESVEEGTSCLLVVGPEGGLSDRERRLMLDAGATAFSLGPGRLRSETAVVAALAALWAGTRSG
jgi:16S rRNA (uracil1498-N3)-methyltransferase